jgi:VanZ family protein
VPRSTSTLAPSIRSPHSSFRAWLAVVAWMSLTVILSTFPVDGLQPAVPDADKLGHAAVYGVLAFLCARAWRRHESSQAAAVERAMAMVLAFGALMEFMQGYVGRDPSLADWIADGVGALVGIAFWKAWIIVANSTPEHWG